MRIPVFYLSIIGKHTALTIYDARHKVGLRIYIRYTLFVNDGLCRCRKVIPHDIQTVFYLCHLFHRDWGSCITFYAALTLADTEVTTELLRQDFRREQHITNLYNRRKLFYHTIGVMPFCSR